MLQIKVANLVNAARNISLWLCMAGIACSKAGGAAASTGKGPAPGSVSEWPMFRGGPALLGVADGNLPAKMNLLWSFKTAGAVRSSAAIANGRVFIGSNDGKVYALNFADGKKAWEFKTGAPVESSPLFREG